LAQAPTPTSNRGIDLETTFDWVTVAVFCALVVLFLHRSMRHEEPKDTILQYMPPAVGCAVANYFGNHDQEPLATVIVVGVVIYIVLVLKPFGGIKFAEKINDKLKKPK
jgi:hypothetical protein